MRSNPRGELGGGGITLSGTEDDDAASFLVPWTPRPVAPKRDIILPAGDAGEDAMPIRAETRARLIEGIAKARK